MESLQKWQASWCDEESPLLSKNDPITWLVYASDMLLIMMHADTAGVIVLSALKKFGKHSQCVALNVDMSSTVSALKNGSCAFTTPVPCAIELSVRM